MANHPKPAELAARWFHEVWNEHRTDIVHELVLADSIAHTDQGDLAGPQAFLTFHAAMVQALPDLRVTVEELIEDGDRVAVRWRATGTHTGKFRGRPATGKPLTFRGTTWIRYRDGKMAEGWDCWDASGVTRQLTGETA
jgi:steroid delta-isomerase-like uncharacterized protein